MVRVHVQTWTLIRPITGPGPLPSEGSEYFRAPDGQLISDH